MFLPFHVSIGKKLPYGPRTVMAWPTSRSRRAAVTRPVLRNVHSMYSVRVGGLATQNVLSPAPGTPYRPNMPTRYFSKNFARSASSANARRNVRTSGASSRARTIFIIAVW